MKTFVFYTSTKIVPTDMLRMLYHDDYRLIISSHLRLRLVLSTRTTIFVNEDNYFKFSLQHLLTPLGTQYDSSDIITYAAVIEHICNLQICELYGIRIEYISAFV